MEDQSAGLARKTHKAQVIDWSGLKVYTVFYHAACWEKCGDIYVVEWIAEGRVTKLRRI